jgi:uncharacterized protein (TIGR02145 family)
MSEKNTTSPDVTTITPSEILYTSALTGGVISSEGASPVTAKGVCWDINPDPTIEKSQTMDGYMSGVGQFFSLISGLTPGTTYFVRAYVISALGTVYGNDLSFTTPLISVKFNGSLEYGNVSDINGNSYKTILIGQSVWMAQNLKTTKFTDGTDIPIVKEDAQWTNLLTPGFCWFDNNDSVYADIYGAYYNWFAISTGKLCPDGWHVPSDTEWQALIDYLGGERVAGSKLKEAGHNNWILSNKDATNASGFTGLPSGLRNATDGTFGGQGSVGNLWSATETSPSSFGAAWSRWIHGDTTVVTRKEIYKKDGLAVRCVKTSI